MQRELKVPSFVIVVQNQARWSKPEADMGLSHLQKEIYSDSAIIYVLFEIPVL
jgi:hypothetical protein